MLAVPVKKARPDLDQQGKKGPTGPTLPPAPGKKNREKGTELIPSAPSADQGASKKKRPWWGKKKKKTGGERKRGEEALTNRSTPRGDRPKWKINEKKGMRQSLCRFRKKNQALGLICGAVAPEKKGGNRPCRRMATYPTSWEKKRGGVFLCLALWARREKENASVSLSLSQSVQGS